MWRYGAVNPILPKDIRHPNVLAVCVAETRSDTTTADLDPWFEHPKEGFLVVSG
jgi:hypothetical protein